jgi:Tfp pilus assembly protein PilO
MLEKKYPMMFSSSKQYRTLASLFVLLLFICGIVWYGILPLQQSLQDKARGIQEFYAGRENRERQMSKLPELKEQYDAIIANEKILDILMKESEVVDFVKTVEQLAAEMHVAMTITSKDAGKVVAVKKPAAKTDQSKEVSILADAPFDQYLSLSIKVDGRYDDIVTFLGKLETLPFGLDVVRIDMKKKAEEEEKDTASFVSGSAANPFSMLGESVPIAVVAESSAEKKDALEAVIDILVYVKKN